MMNDEQGPMENLLDGLDQSTDALSSAELDEELQARGIDGDSVLSKIAAMVATYDKRERLAWMQVADEKQKSFRVAEAPAARWIDRQVEDIRMAFAAFLAAGGPKRALAFKNRGNLSAEDMAAILEANEELEAKEGNRGEQ
jgi:hypothetical protein